MYNYVELPRALLVQLRSSPTIGKHFESIDDVKFVRMMQSVFAAVVGNQPQDIDVERLVRVHMHLRIDREVAAEWLSCLKAALDVAARGGYFEPREVAHFQRVLATVMQKIIDATEHKIKMIDIIDSVAKLVCSHDENVDVAFLLERLRLLVCE